MILTLWVILLILSFTLLIFGYVFYQTQVSDILIIVGWAFVFALGVIMLSNAVEYKIGETETITYSYFEYDYVLDGTNHTSILINNSVNSKVYDYTSFSTEGTGVLARVANSHLWGFFLMIAGLFGGILFWFDVRAYSKLKEEEEINEE